MKQTQCILLSAGGRCAALFCFIFFFAFFLAVGDGCLYGGRIAFDLSRVFMDRVFMIFCGGEGVLGGGMRDR